MSLALNLLITNPKSQMFEMMQMFESVELMSCNEGSS